MMRITVARIDQLAEISVKHNITTTFSPLFVNNGDQEAVDKVMARVNEQFSRGARVWPQVQTRPIDISFSFAVPSLLFIRLPSWYGIMRFGSHEEIVAAFEDSEKRAQLTAEAAAMGPLWDMLVLRQVQSEANQPLVGKRLAEIAAIRNTSALDVMIDLSLEEDLDAHFLAGDMGHNDVERVGALLKHPNVHIGASDGGAHIMSFSTYGDTGYLFSQYVRQTGTLGLEAAVKKITQDPAEIWGLKDRGVLKAGFAADVTIFDAETIDQGDEYYVQDVPGEGSRYVRDAVGVETVLIAGQVAYSRANGYSDATRGQILPGSAA